jgi:hypothetical protein
VDAFDIVRLSERPGLHGCHCTKCDRLFDAHDTPCRLDDGLMRIETLRCPTCRGRKHLMLLLPHRYRAMVAEAVAREVAAEATRRIADKYISRYGST